MNVATSPAATVLGRALSVKNPGAPSARKVTVTAQEANSDARLDRAAIAAKGATLVISVFGEIASEQTLELPPPWTLTGTTGVKYTDPKGLHGPVKSLTLKKTATGVDPTVRYESPTFGLTDGTTPTQLGGKGRLVIGTFGRQGLNMDAIGLVLAAPDEEPTKVDKP